VTNNECEQEGILDVLRRRREAHERLLKHFENWRTGKYKPSDAKPITPETEERPAKTLQRQATVLA
jgi:hypothetical protein